MELQKLPERLLEAARGHNLIPLVGAGVSRMAAGFPSWTGLLGELCEYGFRNGRLSKTERTQINTLVREGKILMAAQAIRSALPPDELEGFLGRRFDPPEAQPGPLHFSILKLEAPILLTTNYDCLLEDAYAGVHRKTPLLYTYKDAPSVQRFLQGYSRSEDRPLIFKLHGSARAPDDVIFSELDYRKLLYREPGYRTVLSALFVTKVILMLGFSFSDPELRLLAESLRDSLKYRSSPDYIVLPRDEKNSVERKRLREDFGLDVIEYNPAGDHRELREMVEFLGRHAASSKNGSGRKLPRIPGRQESNAGSLAGLVCPRELAAARSLTR